MFYDKNDSELYGDLYDKNEKKIIKIIKIRKLHVKENLLFYIYGDFKQNRRNIEFWPFSTRKYDKKKVYSVKKRLNLNIYTYRLIKVTPNAGKPLTYR